MVNCRSMPFRIAQALYTNLITFGAEAAHKVFANLGVHGDVHVPVGAVVDVADALQVERTDGHLFRVDLVCEQAAADLAFAL